MSVVTRSPEELQFQADREILADKLASDMATCSTISDGRVLALSNYFIRKLTCFVTDKKRIY